METIRCKYYDIESCNVTATKCTISPSRKLTLFNTVSERFDPLPCMKSLKKSELVYSVIIVHSEAVIKSEFVVGFEFQKYAVDYEITELDVAGSKLHKYTVDHKIKLSQPAVTKLRVDHFSQASAEFTHQHVNQSTSQSTTNSHHSQVIECSCTPGISAPVVEWLLGKDSLLSSS